MHSGQVLDSPRLPRQPSEQPTPPPNPHPPALSSPFCYALITVCAVVAVLDMRVTGPVAFVSREPLPPGILYGALEGPAVAAGEWWRVLSTVFVHGGLIHLLFNMSAVWNLGRPVEHFIGTARFAVVSLVSAIGAALFALAFSFDGSTVGASGMILGWAGVLLPVATPAVRRNLWTSLLLVAVISLQPGISWQGHLGGLLFGLPGGFALRTRRRELFWGVCLTVALVGVVLMMRVVAAETLVMSR